MRKITISTFAVLFLAISITARADVYVKVDSNGNAIDGAIVCDAGVCGDPTSLYSTLTLKPGERYVLQGSGTVGIGGNNPNTEVKVDLQTNVWTVTNKNEENKPVTVQTFQTIEQVTQPSPQPTPTPTPVPVVDSPTVTTETSTVTTKTETATVNMSITETVTVTTETATVVTSVLDESLDLSWNWEKILAWLIAFLEQMYARQS